MNRQARLFAIAEHLRARRTGVTAEALAERFGVALRTIYRDLDALRDAALPVHADRGRGGGYALDRAYTLPPVNFSPREAALLESLARWAIQQRLIPFTDTLQDGLDKVRGALTAAGQRELSEQMEQLKLVGVPGPRIDPAVRRAVERAWFERQPLRIRYRAADGILSTRLVRIAAAVMERGGVTLLNCDDLDKGERRQFRLDRIEAAELV